MDRLYGLHKGDPSLHTPFREALQLPYFPQGPRAITPALSIVIRPIEADTSGENEKILECEEATATGTGKYMDDNSEEFIEFVKHRRQEAIDARHAGEKFYTLEELQNELGIK